MSSSEADEKQRIQELQAFVAAHDRTVTSQLIYELHSLLKKREGFLSSLPDALRARVESFIAQHQNRFTLLDRIKSSTREERLKEAEELRLKVAVADLQKEELVKQRDYHEEQLKKATAERTEELKAAGLELTADDDDMKRIAEQRAQQAQSENDAMEQKQAAEREAQGLKAELDEFLRSQDSGST